MEFEWDDEKVVYKEKQNVTIRLSPRTIQRAKSLGKGYTSILGRILESALENPETIEHFL